MLQANLELVDAGLVEVMRELAAQLLAEGEETNGRWLSGWADNIEQALGSLSSGAGQTPTSPLSGANLVVVLRKHEPPS